MHFFTYIHGYCSENCSLRRDAIGESNTILFSATLEWDPKFTEIFWYSLLIIYLILEKGIIKSEKINDFYHKTNL